MNEKLRIIINLCNDYNNGIVDFDFFDKKFDKFLFACKYNEEIEDILNKLQYDIAMTTQPPYNDEDKAEGYFTQEQLKEKVANYLKDLAIVA